MPRFFVYSRFLINIPLYNMNRPRGPLKKKFHSLSLFLQSLLHRVLRTGATVPPPQATVLLLLFHFHTRLRNTRYQVAARGGSAARVMYTRTREGKKKKYRHRPVRIISRLLTDMIRKS